MKKKLLDDILGIIADELRRLGMRKMKGVHMCTIGDNVSGWLGLNVAVNRADGRIGINPVVGVRHDLIEKTIKRLFKQKESRLLPTISTSLGYVMPQGKYLEWLFEPAPFDYASEVRSMVKAIEEYGIPFMRSNANLEDIVHHLENLRFTSKDVAAYKLPVAYLLLGETELAVAHTRKQLIELGSRNDAAAQQFKNFASNLFLAADFPILS